MGQTRKYPECLQGVSLEGKVLQSVADRVKVHQEIDKEQDENVAWEFPYQTMYAAEGAGGWHCMPKHGRRWNFLHQIR